MVAKRDFKSLASTSFATRADSQTCILNHEPSILVLRLLSIQDLKEHKRA